VLHSIETAINSSLDLHFTLEHLINQVITQLNVDASTILLLNNDTQVLEYVVSKGFRSNALKYTRLKMGESNAGISARERRIVSIPDLTQKPEGFEQSKLFNEENFISYFAVPLVAKGQLLGVLELFHRNFLGSDSEWLEFLKTIASQAANAIDNAVLFDRLQKSNLNLTLAYDTTIEGWSHAMDMRDSETEGHSRRVTEVTVRIAQKFGIADEELVHIRRGALLHDLGKIGIPDSILLKPGKLTDEEWKIMKHHPEYAYALLHKIDYLKPALDIPYFHHEKWDGTGYPKGLKGMEIPLAARIFAVVDVWDALRADRPYRSAWPKEKVLEHIRSDAGTHFDPTVVETFLKLSEIDE
jgi:HD-GYP domain-containing protein (c-di-GMP phosphodiesterase class II)